MQGIVNPYTKYDYRRMLKDLQKLQKKYAFEVEIIGTTFEGRDIPMIVIGEGTKKVLLVGAHHGREYITSAYLMRSIEMLCSLTARSTILQGMETELLLHDRRIYIIPMLNPDGVNISIFGPDSAQYPNRIRKMRLIGPTYETWKSNANGVDLNRSYPCLFEQKSTLVGSPASELYKGEAPGRENEVEALMRLCDQEGFLAAVSFHAKGEEIIWADRNTVARIPEAAKMAEALARVSGYKIMPPSADPAGYTAGFENWFRERYGRPCILIKISPHRGGFIPHPMKEFDLLVWESAKYIVPTIANFV
jgi:Predicted carboxypeptidase